MCTHIRNHKHVLTDAHDIEWKNEQTIRCVHHDPHFDRKKSQRATQRRYESKLSH